LNKKKSSHLPNKQVKPSKKDTEKSEDFPVEVAEVIKELPKDKQQTLIKAFAVRKHYSGPLPDGDTIQIYDAVIPNVELNLKVASSNLLITIHYL